MDHKSAVQTLLSVAPLILALGCSGPTPEPEDQGLTPVEETASATAPPELGPVVELADSAAQIAAAITAAPEDLRETASVYGYDEESGLVLLRQGTGELICLADGSISSFAPNSNPSVVSVAGKINKGAQTASGFPSNRSTHPVTKIVP